MVDTKKIKILQWFLILFMFIGVSCIMLFQEKQSCMGVTLIDKSKLENYTNTLNVDFKDILFNGENVAVDVEKGIIYISQSGNQLSHNSVLQGVLETKIPEYRLYFLDNEEMKDIENTVRKGIPLSLAILNESEMQIVDVIISTLPILKISGEYMETDEEDRDIFNGSMSLFAGYDPTVQGYSVKTSELRWRKRGNITAREAKNSWKLTLTKNDENRNVELLGMGADDDWILNSMIKDDTKIKEKLFMELWNELADKEEYNYKMSTGEYVEVVINDKYMGIYLLQRRVDAKYLELENKDILLKATQNWAKTTEEAYEIINEVDDFEKVYGYMRNIFELTDCSDINVDNLIDVNIIILLMNGIDNARYKNMFFLLKEDADGYEVFLIPWDTDIALGLVWVNELDDYVYNYQVAMADYAQRRETESVKISEPDYDKKRYYRWEELKQNIFSSEYIVSKVETLEEVLNLSGSMQREIECWGYKYGGEDNIENLLSFIEERRKQMDVYYSLE